MRISRSKNAGSLREKKCQLLARLEEIKKIHHQYQQLKKGYH